MVSAYTGRELMGNLGNGVSLYEQLKKGNHVHMDQPNFSITISDIHAII